LKKKLFLAFLFSVVLLNLSFGQRNNIKITATLNTETNELQIYQEIDFYNKSDSTLNNIYFHNWPNAYKDKKTPLAKRFVEKNSKTFHFTKEKNRGNTQINNMFVNYDLANWEITTENPDVLNLKLNEPLQSKDSIKIIANYTVKLPKDKFTRYGANTYNYNLRYWYLTPAIFDTNGTLTAI